MRRKIYSYVYTCREREAERKKESTRPYVARAKDRYGVATIKTWGGYD